MVKKGEVLWEVGKQLPKEAWGKAWSRGEIVESPKFTMPGICTLQIFFYPGGMSDSDYPKFKLVRSDATLKSSNIQGEVQFLHGDTLAARFLFEEKFERGNTDYVHGFQDFQDLRRLRIFHSLPELGYRYIYTVSDPDPHETVPVPNPSETVPEPDPNETVPEPDPNETVPEPDSNETVPEPNRNETVPEPDPKVPEPEPGRITSVIDFVWSGIDSARSYVFGSVLNDQFEKGNTDYVHGFLDFQNLRRLRFFHSLSDLKYRNVYKVPDQDPNEIEPEPIKSEPEPLPEPDSECNRFCVERN